MNVSAVFFGIFSVEPFWNMWHGGYRVIMNIDVS